MFTYSIMRIEDQNGITIGTLQDRGNGMEMEQIVCGTTLILQCLHKQLSAELANKPLKR